MRARSTTFAAALALAGLAGVAGAACSGDDGASDGGASSTSAGDDTATPGTEGGAGSTNTTAGDQEDTVQLERPDGAAATFGGPLEGGDGVFLATAGGGPVLADVGYAEAEYAASGTATAYATDAPLPTDGILVLRPDGEAAYTTRVLVRRPVDPADFDGTVVVEWLNVSSGADAAPDYTYLAEEIVRQGHAWVGVSAQRIGIEGGAIAVAVPNAEGRGLGVGIRAWDPERYGELSHPGDAYAYDIFTQVARALRSPGALDPLDGLEVRRLVAAGESQSAFALTTYVNGVQPLTLAFDGFLVHSRGGSSLPLGVPGGGVDIASSLANPATTIRTDGPAPVLVVQTEGDVLGVLNYLPARQPDDERFRLWEIAGTAHADAFQVGPMESTMGCAAPINRGQQAFVVRAALRSLVAWVRDGTEPPEAERLAVDTSGAAPAYELDEVGNVLGGVRTPVVDAPVDVLSGLAPEGSSIICLLLGSTLPIPADVLAARYGTADEYLAAYEAATDAAIDAGFLLLEDRAEILAGADPTRLPT